MTTTATPTRAHASELDAASFTVASLAGEHADLLLGVQRRAYAVDALIDARIWPHSELATLTGYLCATLLRQVSDEEHLLYPHDLTAAPFAELSAAHAQLHELTRHLDEIREQRCPLPQLRELVDGLLTTLRRHLIEEQAVLAALAHTHLDVPATAMLSETRQHWPVVPDDGPVVIQLDALPTTAATQLCIERVLRLQPGEHAVIHSRDRAQLHDVRAWLHEFDAARFALTTASDPHGGTRLDVTCRDLHRASRSRG